MAIHDEYLDDDNNEEKNIDDYLPISENDDLRPLIPPPTQTTTSHFRITRRGRILKSASEVYTRSDLGYGFTHIGDQNGNSNENNGGMDKITTHTELLSVLGPSKRLIIATSQSLLHNMDVIEHDDVDDVIVVTQSSLAQCRNVSHSCYTRVMELLSRARDDNSGDGTKTVTSIDTEKNKKRTIFFPDRHHASTAGAGGSDSGAVDDASATAAVAQFYCDLLNDDNNTRVIVLGTGIQKKHTDDETKSYEVLSVKDYVTLLEAERPHLSLSDIVAQLSSSAADDNDFVNDDPTKKRHTVAVGAKHLSLSDILLGVKKGTYHQGTLKSERSGFENAYVTISKKDERIAVRILGMEDINRAVDGDIVAIKIHPLDKWIDESSSSSSQKTATTTDDDSRTTVGLSRDVGDSSIRDEENVNEVVPIDSRRSLMPTARVVGIVRRNFRRDYCGSLHSVSSSSSPSRRDRWTDAHERDHVDGSSTCLFFPVDRRIPPILIRTVQRDRLVKKRFLACIDSWPLDSPFPLGHYVRVLGDVGDKSVETEVLLREHDIAPSTFSEKVLSCLPPPDFKIQLDESQSHRLDLRHLPILSIDPPGCKDIDDALHCVALPGDKNLLQVGVHIADVTHYVKPQTAIDLEAAKRSTSTYLVDKRLDMLPSRLTTDLCSLNPNVDRFAFSVLFTVTKEAHIVDVSFQKTIIRSIAALTYKQAQSYIDHPDDNDDDDHHNTSKNPSPSDQQIQIRAVKRLHSLSRIFKEKRLAAGALTLASPEVKFTLDAESVNPTDVTSYAMLEANALVEEFMLLANVTVAKKILRHYPTLSILRRHPRPTRARFAPLLSKAASRGLSLAIDTSRDLAVSLDNATIPSDPYVNKLLRILSTRCLSPAQYLCAGDQPPREWHHYGLAAPVYTHFTSPIRRYADVCVHRLLAASIGVESLPVALSRRGYLHDLCRNMNRRHRGAQLAGRASVELHTVLLFEGKAEGVTEAEGYVLDVEVVSGGGGGVVDGEDCRVTVFVPRYGIEGKVVWPEGRTVRKEGEWKVGDGTISLEVFDKVRVGIEVKKKGDGEEKELVMTLLENAIPDKKKRNRKSDKESSKKRKKNKTWMG